MDTTYQAQIREINESNRQWMQARFDAFDARLDAFEAKMDAKMEAKLAAMRVQMVLWMFGFWTATVIPIMGLMLALNGSFRP